MIIKNINNFLKIIYLIKIGQSLKFTSSLPIKSHQFNKTQTICSNLAKKINFITFNTPNVHNRPLNVNHKDCETSPNGILKISQGFNSSINQETMLVEFDSMMKFQ